MLILAAAVQASFLTYSDSVFYFACFLRSFIIAMAILQTLTRNPSVARGNAVADCVNSSPPPPPKFPQNFRGFGGTSYPSPASLSPSPLSANRKIQEHAAFLLALKSYSSKFPACSRLLCLQHSWELSLLTMGAACNPLIPVPSFFV